MEPVCVRTWQKWPKDMAYYRARDALLEVRRQRQFIKILEMGPPPAQQGKKKVKEVCFGYVSRKDHPQLVEAERRWQEAKRDYLFATGRVFFDDTIITLFPLG